MAWPVVTVTSGGIPVTDVSGTNGLGTPVEEAANGFGTAVTYVANGGLPVLGGAPRAPSILFSPVVLSKQVGQSLSYSTGAWLGYPAPTITHQWKVNGVNVADNYVIQAGDVGLPITISETAINTLGSATSTSAGVNAVSVLAIAVGGRFKTGDSAFVSSIASGAVGQRGGTYYFLNNTGKTLNSFKVGYSYFKLANSGSNGVRETLIDTAGSGYTTITITADPPAAGGQTATFGGVLAGGALTAIYTILAGQYALGETPNLTITGDGSGATAHVSRLDGIGWAAFRMQNTATSDVEYPIGTHSSFLFGGSATAHPVRGTTVVSDALTVGSGVTNGTVFGIRDLEPGVTAPTFTAVRDAGTNTITSITWTGGVGLWETSYALTGSGGGGTGMSATLYTYQGAPAAIVMNSVGQNYTGVPAVAMNVNFERPVVAGPLTGDRNTANGLIASQTVDMGPQFITAVPSAFAPSVAILGDSIANGNLGGDTLGDWLGNFGMLDRALGQAGIGTARITIPGMYASSLAQNSTAPLAMMAAIPGLTAAIGQCSTNDFARGDSLATVQANVIAAATAYRTVVPKVFWTTCEPQSNSSNLYIDLAGQSLKLIPAQEAARTAFNDWLRGGAPWVFSGKVLIAGQSGHPLTGYFEIADQIESSRNSGKFIPVAFQSFYSAGAITGDGVHTRDVGHAMKVGRLKALSGGGGSGYTVPPTVSFTGLGFPLIQLNFTAGAFTGITVLDDAGIAYPLGPPPNNILSLNGAGSGASFKFTLDGTTKRINGATSIVAGGGYTSGGLLSLAGALLPQAHMAVNGDGTLTPVLDFPGGGITTVPTVVLTGGDGSGAAVTATIMKGIDTSLLG